MTAWHEFLSKWLRVQMFWQVCSTRIKRAIIETYSQEAELEFGPIYQSR